MGALAAATAAVRGARVLVVERGPRVGATGPSTGAVRCGNEPRAGLEPAVTERPLIEHRMLVLDDAACVSFDFRDLTMARGPAPAASVRSAIASVLWTESARSKGGRILTDARDLHLLTNRSGTVTGVSASGESYEAPVTIRTEPIEDPVAGSTTARLEETYAIAVRSLENRFQLRPGQGTSIECLLGFLPTAWSGTGWLLTHREHLTLGVTLRRPPGDEAATGLESAFEKFRSHPAIQGYTTRGERVDRREYSVERAPTQGQLAPPGLLRAGAAVGLGDPIGVFAPGLSAALESGRAAGESVPMRGEPATGAGPSYLRRLKGSGVLDHIAWARAHPTPLGWTGAREGRYARLLARTFHELLTESGAPKEPITRTLRRIRRESRTPFPSLAGDALRLGRNL